MEAYFQSYHPKGGIRLGRGLMHNFFFQLKKKFPHYPDPILDLVSRLLTRFRIRTINQARTAKPLARKKLNACMIKNRI